MMPRKLPKINKGFSSQQMTVREYLEDKLDANKIPERLSGYLCEREIYTPENYDKVREKYSEYINEHIDEINAACATHNKKVFLQYLDKALTLTNDWVAARMLIHCCIQEFSLVGGMVSLFEWGDDLMIDFLHTSSLNR